MVKIGTVAMKIERNTEKNLETYLKYIKEAAEQKVDLICFSELSLQGFPDSMSFVDIPSTKYIHEVAELVPEGPSTQKIIGWAKEYNMYIEYGMYEQDPVKHDFIYNAAVLVGPEGFIGKYHKVHLPGDEIMYDMPGDDYYVYDTKIGRIGMMICYDKMFPEVARILKIKGADIILAPTAWPSANKSDDDPAFKLYKMANEFNAMVNSVPIVDSNGVSDETPDGFECGNSRILNSNGDTVATTGFSEGLAVAELDLVEEAKCRQWSGTMGTLVPTMNFMRDRKPSTYSAILEY